MTIALAILATLGGSIGFILGAAITSKRVGFLCQAAFEDGYDRGFLTGASDRDEVRS